MIVIGILVCLGAHFGARRAMRRWLQIRGARTLSRQAEPSYFETPPRRRLAWRLAGPSAAYLLSTLLVLLMLLANGEEQSGTRIVGPAISEAAALPFVGAIRAGKLLWSDLADAPKADLAGPVGIVHAMSGQPARPHARIRFLLMLLAYPTAFVWPMSPFVELLLTPRRRRTA
jgi:hypothetical protein